MSGKTKIIRKQILLTTGGCTNISLYPSSASETIYAYHVVEGTETLTSDFDITAIEKTVRYRYLNILWNANVTTGGNSVTILGKTVSESVLAAGSFIVEAWYDGDNWVVSIIPIATLVDTEDIADTAVTTPKIENDAVTTPKIAASSVTTAKIADNSVELAKMYELATGSVIFGNASNRPTALSVADSTIVVGDSSTGLVSVAVSGDATLTKTGALTIANSAVTTAKIDDGAVTAAKLDSNVKRFSFTVQIDFSSASRLGGTINIPICYNCVIDDLHGTVMDPVLSTCSSIFKDDSGTVMTGSQIDITTGHLLGNVVNSTPTANNVFSSGDVLKIEPSAAGTLAGEVLYTICGYLT